MKQNYAFSLLELSIVLVIIGLIAGGIVAGSSMIRAAELRSIITEKEQFSTAIYTFRDKYLGYPGDLKNAEAFWGTMATGTCPSATAGTGTQTCNGDGDSLIENPAAAGQTGEIFTFWQHLSNAELINGTFEGIAGSAGAGHSVPDENVPSSKLSGGCWGIQTLGDFAGDTSIYELDYGKALFIGGPSTSNNCGTALLTPEEAWNLDTKMDDGLPARGKVIARYWNNACSAADDGSHANDDYAASYNLSSKTVACTVFFRKIF